MLKRILIIAFFTVSGQLLSIFVLKYVSEHSTVSQMKAIVEIDSLMFLILNIIALVLQGDAMRNLVKCTDWKREYYDTQRARITLCLLLLGCVTLAFINQYFLIFLI